MNVLILGSGGREHALAYTVSKSSKCSNLFVMPGNPGMENIATCLDLNPLNHEQIKATVSKYKINLIIPGSEVYLENGVADEFIESDVIVFGPTKKAAKIESSKEFAKDLMKKYRIPTGKYEVFSDYEKASKYVKNEGTPIVIKYDGLAGGKGVVVAMSELDAITALQDMLVLKKFGDAKVIIEEFLEGPEFSLMCFVHSNTIIPMPIAQDHKRLLDNDQGPNTGGMGIYSSVPIISEKVIRDTMESIMKPTINAMIEMNATFTGFLYGGIMLTKDGPKVIEFNARFGDPEAEVILPKLESDILDIITNIMDDRETTVSWSTEYHVGVVLASQGYPNKYKKGYSIEGLEDCEDLVFHMGTSRQKESLLTNGGRVLLVTGTAKTLEKAIEKAYTNVRKVKCQNLIYRSDIGKKSITR